MLVPVEIAKREIRRRERTIQPRPSGRQIDGSVLRGDGAGRRADVRVAERLHANRLAALLNPDAMIQRKTRERLDETARPDDRHLDDPLTLAKAEQQLLRVLGQ